MEETQPRRPRRPKKRDLLDTFRAGWVRELNASKLTRAEVEAQMAKRGFPGWTPSRISKFVTGRLGATLDECDALAAIVSSRIEDLLELDQTSQQLHERVEAEWYRMTTLLEDINRFFFALLDARKSFTKAATRLMNRIDLDAENERAEWGRLPSLVEFERRWNLIEMLIHVEVMSKSGGRRDLAAVASSEPFASVIDGILLALSSEPDADDERKRVLIEKALEAHHENAIYVVTNEMAEVAHQLDVREERARSAKEGTLSEQEDAKRALDTFASTDRSVLRRRLQALQAAELKRAASPPAD